MNVRSLRNIFLTGLAFVLPIVVTVWFVWWVGTSFETLLGGLYKFLFGETLYFPGLGILLGLALTFSVGLMTKAWLFRSVFAGWDRLLNRIPLIKTVYGAVQDFMQFISGQNESKFDRVVLIELEQPAVKLMGFVTRDDFEQFPDLAGDDEVAVYLPMSYQVGGYTLLMPRSQLQVVDMPAEDALRFVLTAGLSARGAGEKSADAARQKPE